MYEHLFVIHEELRDDQRRLLLGRVHLDVGRVSVLVPVRETPAPDVAVRECVASSAQYEMRVAVTVVADGRTQSARRV
jgi:hypothetical protein